MTKIPQIFIWGFLLLGVLAIFFPVIAGNEVTKQSREHRLPRRLWASRNDELIILGFCLLFLIIGVIRVQISDFNVANDKLAELNGRGQVVLTGVISDEPDVRDTSQKIKVKVGNSTILVTTGLYPEYKYLDRIKLTGKLETPIVTDDFNYKNYLLKDHIYSVMNFAKIEIIGKVGGSSLSKVYSGILFLKQKLNQSIQDNSLPPHSLILEGIILGNNKNMTQDLRQKLSNTGLRFLTAISGVHVIILSAILVSFLMSLRLGRIQAGSLSLIFIWLYVALTGFTASGIRAATMGSIFILAGVFGRQNTSSRTIVLAASLMLLQNPLLLIYDVGFQLSFLACLGIIYLKPAVNYLFGKLFMGKLKELTDLISVTLSAQIFTLPLMVYNFGVMPLVGPITSILILPVMPEILAFGFIFSILGAFSKILGWIFYVPCWILITYFLKVVDFFSQPQMAKPIPNISWTWVLTSYLAIAIGTWFLNNRYSRKYV